MRKDEFVFKGGTVKIGQTQIDYDSIGNLPIGERHVIIGRNGSGKTTLLRCLSEVIPEVYYGIVKLTGSVNGLPLFRGNRDIGKGILGVMPQDMREFMLGLKVAEEWEIALSNSVFDKSSFAKYVFSESNLGELVDRSSSELSDGERQRMALACLLVRGNKWVVLDEWSSHLDEEWLKKFDGLLTKVVKETRGSSIELMATSVSKVDHIRSLSTNVYYQEESYNSTSISERLRALSCLLAEFSDQKAHKKFDELFHPGEIRYYSFRKIMDPFVAPKGTFTVVLGRNASGKTSLLKGIRWRKGSFWKFKPTLVLADPKLQLLGKNISSILKSSINPLHITKLERAVQLVSSILNIPRTLDPLELNFASKKMLALIAAVLNQNQGLLVDEPFTSFDRDSTLIAGHALRFAVNELKKAVVISSPRELPAEIDLEPNIQRIML